MGCEVNCEGVSKTFGTNTIVKNATFQLKSATFTALMGASGCGKSTVLNMLAGLELPSSGSIEIDGVNLRGRSRAFLDDFRLSHIGMVFQFFHLLPTLTLLENALLPVFEKYAKDRKNSLARAEFLFERLGLSQAGSQFPDEVSGGMQQRAALARAILLRPALLLADEPTGNLDSKNGAEVMQILSEAHKELGTTVLLVTHDARAAAHAQNVLHMRDGQIGIGFVLDDQKSLT